MPIYARIIIVIIQDYKNYNPVSILYEHALSNLFIMAIPIPSFFTPSIIQKSTFLISIFLNEVKILLDISYRLLILPNGINSMS